MRSTLLGRHRVVFKLSTLTFTQFDKPVYPSDLLHEYQPYGVAKSSTTTPALPAGGD